jgi:hypothetical protein
MTEDAPNLTGLVVVVDTGSFRFFFADGADTALSLKNFFNLPRLKAISSF